MNKVNPADPFGLLAKLARGEKVEFAKPAVESAPQTNFRYTSGDKNYHGPDTGRRWIPVAANTLKLIDLPKHFRYEEMREGSHDYRNIPSLMSGERVAYCGIRGRSGE